MNYRHKALLGVVFLVVGLFAVMPVAQELGGELIAGVSADPVGFDPHVTSAYSSFEVLENVYDTLVSVGFDLRPIPALAESWEVSDDGLTWTFHIRHSAIFHNGRPAEAADVKYSLDRIVNPETGSGRAWRLAAMENVEVGDSHTVLIHLKHAYPGLLTKLGSYKGMAIVAKETVDDGTISTHPVGTGPFRFVKYVPGDQVVLEKDPNYWQEGKPYLDRLIYKIIPDETVRITSLLTGDVDWVDSVPPQRIMELKVNQALEIGEITGTSYWYLAANLNREPLDNKVVRQAIAMGINREEIAAAAKWDAALPNDGPIPPDSYYSTDYHPFLNKQGVDEAKQMLSDAGYPDGFKADVIVSNFYPETVRSALVLQSQLEELGIELEIRVLEWGTWLEEEGSGNFDMYICGWIGNVDPDDYFYAQHHTGEGFNFTGYSNPYLDELLEAGRKEADPEERYEIYKEVQEIVISDAPYVYLYIPNVVHAWQPKVNGYRVHPGEAIRFVDTWIEG